jgi:hypothetical protein
VAIERDLQTAALVLSQDPNTADKARIDEIFVLSKIT